MTTADDELNQWLANGEMAKHNEEPSNPIVREAARELAARNGKRVNDPRGPGKTALPIVINGQAVNIRPKRSNLEMNMQAVIDTALSQFPHLAKPEVEYKFHKTRNWRFDFAWPGYVLAIEAEGGTWLQTTEGFSKGHGHPKRFEDDCEKYNEAALDGWMVLRFTGDMIKDGRALAVVLAALKLFDYDTAVTTAKETQ